MIIENKFHLSQTVYLTTDESQKARLVTGILIQHEGTSYRLVAGVEVSWHYDFEICEEKNIFIKTE